MNAVKRVAKNIKENPVPYLTAVAGVAVGVIITKKMTNTHVYTLGHMHSELAKSGFEILIVTTELADKIAPLNQG